MSGLWTNNFYKDMQWRLQIKQAKELQSDNSDNLPLPDSETQVIIFANLCRSCNFCRLIH
ncbi:hypothetical protein AtNW77_Chr5g0106781 [Arabidopsis thaliana]